MKTDIFIVSVGKHFKYLKYALRSIKKYATGFQRVVLMIPTCDVTALHQFMGESPENMEVFTFNEWVGKGMLYHMFLEMEAPNYCDGADAIVHFDSDWAFQEPVTPDDYIRDGKPICVYASFDWLCSTQQANLRQWQIAVEAAIGKPAQYEMMRLPQLIHIPETYRKAKEEIERHTHTPMDRYIFAQRDEYPQTFAEYPTLGMIAWRHFYDKYHWINQETEPFPKIKVYQAWSHCDPTPENIAEYKRIGIYD